MTQVVSRRLQPDLVLILPFTGPPGASELARSIKEDPETTDIPVLILVDSDSRDPDTSMVYPTEACASVARSDEDLLKTMRAVRKQRPRLLERERAHEHQHPRSNGKPSSTIEGDFADDTFPGVLEFLFTARKTGRIVVLEGAGRRPGYIYVEDGNVMHCELAPNQGVDAFDRMCFLAKGTFKFEPEFRAGTRTMRRNGKQILLDSARRRDERSRAIAIETPTPTPPPPPPPKASGRSPSRFGFGARRFRSGHRMRRAV
jgi:hypothetical protein